jgi:hypothetical protein
MGNLIFTSKRGILSSSLIRNYENKNERNIKMRTDVSLHAIK